MIKITNIETLKEFTNENIIKPFFSEHNIEDSHFEGIAAMIVLTCSRVSGKSIKVLKHLRSLEPIDINIDHEMRTKFNDWIARLTIIISWADSYYMSLLYG
jgi:hypothetical protein